MRGSGKGWLIEFTLAPKFQLSDVTVNHPSLYKHTVVAILKFNLLLFASLLVACGGGSSTPPSNSAPVVSNIEITDTNGGQVWVGDRLVGSHVYRDTEGDLEGATAFQWQRGGMMIAGADKADYQVAEGDVGQQISLRVTPAAVTGTLVGLPALSVEVQVDGFVGARQLAQIVTSTYTGQTYTVSAYLPDGYSASAQDYPVIYMLGEVASFTQVADLLDAKARQVILIAVTTEPERRAVDLTMPEAPKFYDFFAHELIPLLEAQYRVDTSNRTLAGHSLGGLFVGLVMLFETPGARLFGSFISADGSFWSEWEQTVLLEQKLADVSSELPVNLILTAGAGRTSNLYSVIDFRYLLTQRSYTDFNLTYVPFALTHSAVYLPSLSAGIDALFP
jgi:hypothetical protein